MLLHNIKYNVNIESKTEKVGNLIEYHFSLSMVDAKEYSLQKYSQHKCFEVIHKV